MKKPQKIRIQEKLGEISPYDLSLSQEEAFSIFGVTPNHEYDSITTDFDVDDRCWAGCEYRLQLYGYREETDEEYNKRVQKIQEQNSAAKRAKTLKEKQERELYEKLKKKFEK